MSLCNEVQVFWVVSLGIVVVLYVVVIGVVVWWYVWIVVLFVVLLQEVIVIELVVIVEVLSVLVIEILLGLVQQEQYCLQFILILLLCLVLLFDLDVVFSQVLQLQKFCECEDFFDFVEVDQMLVLLDVQVQVLQCYVGQQIVFG